MYSIKLANGKVIDNLELNGNNFIPEILDKNIFTGNLNTITITDKHGNIEELYNQKVQFAKIGDKETFILSGKSKDEIEKEINNEYMFDIDYRLTLKEMGL